jgi:DNA-binding transcriptional ArsR family regulator
MVNNESRHLDRVFHALADSTRREILNRLTERRYTIGELAEPFQMSLAAVSKHIKVLEEAGLLTRTRDGRIHRCAMNAEPLKAAQDVISFYRSFWEQQFRSLDRYLQESMSSLDESTPDGDSTQGEKNGSRKK